MNANEQAILRATVLNAKQSFIEYGSDANVKTGMNVIHLPVLIPRALTR